MQQCFETYRMPYGRHVAYGDVNKPSVKVLRCFKWFNCKLNVFFQVNWGTRTTATTRMTSWSGKRYVGVHKPVTVNPMIRSSMLLSSSLMNGPSTYKPCLWLVSGSFHALLYVTRSGSLRGSLVTVYQAVIPCFSVKTQQTHGKSEFGIKTICIIYPHTSYLFQLCCPALRVYDVWPRPSLLRVPTQAYVHKSVMEELKRIIDDSEITKEDDALWPPPDRVGRQVCDSSHHPWWPDDLLSLSSGLKNL